jgi:hypothetical protein
MTVPIPLRADRTLRAAAEPPKLYSRARVPRWKCQMLERSALEQATERREWLMLGHVATQPISPGSPP